MVGSQGVASPKPPRPALLVSVHDVSPLTLAASRSAVDIVIASGVPMAALTVLVIPCHQGRAPLDEHPDTCAWLRELHGQGAQLVMHGYSHRMRGHCFSPRGLFWAHGFARGQAEFFRSDAAETKQRLEQGKAILVRAGLGEATTSFVPPAWLLSPAARRVVLDERFDCHEEIGGIVTTQGRQARRLIGWGSLNALEACATRWWSALQCHRADADTRLAIHPADMTRSKTVAAIHAALRKLVARSTPRTYRDFLQAIQFATNSDPSCEVRS
jgi:predicted deacetylase